MKKTLHSLLKKIAKSDPLRAGYLKRNIKVKDDKVIYYGNKNIINNVLDKAKIKKK